MATINVTHDGDNDTSGATLKTEIEDASNGDIVIVSAGTFNADDSITVPAGVTVRGNGGKGTAIESQTIVTSTGMDAAAALVTTGQNALLEDMVLDAQTGHDGESAHALSWFNVAHITKATARRCWLKGMADAVLVFFASGTESEIFLEDCEIDAATVAGGSTDNVISLSSAGSTNLVLRRCNINTVGNGTHEATGVKCGGSAFNVATLLDCNINVSAGGGASGGSTGIRAQSGLLNQLLMAGGSIRTAASAGDVFDMESTGGMITHTLVDFDPTKTDGTRIYEAISQTVATAAALAALTGDGWANFQNAKGHRRVRAAALELIGN